jgi:raffinose/stachyose/melibiose transport system permease protein
MLDLTRLRSRIGWTIGLVVIAALFAFPLYSMVQISFRGQGVLANYAAILGQPRLPSFFLTTLIIAAGTVVISYAVTMLAAYAFARLRMAGREPIFYLMLATLTLPTVALTVPLFAMVDAVGLFDNYLAVIVPLAALIVPFNLLLARSFVASLPAEVFEAATLDGCGTWGVFWRIVLPMTRPVAGVVVIWAFLAAWNEYVLALLFLQSPDRQPITLLPQFFVSELGTDQPKIVAASVVIALPIVVVYIVLQRFFERGVTAGAIK